MLPRDSRLCGAVKTLEMLVGKGWRGERPVCVLVDDFSVLLNVGVDLSEVILFVQRCMHLLTSNQGPCKVSIYINMYI